MSNPRPIRPDPTRPGPMRRQTRPPEAARPPLAPRPAGPVRIVVRRKSNNSAWAAALLLLLAFGGAFFYWLYQNQPPTQITAEETEEEPEYQPQTPEWKLPPIIENPESDGEVPPMDTPTSEETDSDFEPDDSPPPAPPPPPAKAAPKPLPRPKLIKKTITNKIIPNPLLPPPQTTRTVDILIVYTKATKDSLGGPRGVLARANEVIAYTNRRFHEGKVKGTLRLVGLVETDYVAPTEGDVVKHGLGAISSGYARCGGKSEGVHKIRNKVGADLVCIWVAANRRGGGGLAQIHGPWSSMNYPVGSIFRHEMAHNYGWNHGDRQNYSMIHKNYPGMAKWNRTKVSKDRLYVQYWATVEESKDRNEIPSQ